MKSFILTTIILSIAICGCTTTQTTITNQQKVAANAVEDILNIGLVPILSNNPSSISQVQAFSLVLRTMATETFNEQSLSVLFSKTEIDSKEAKDIAAIVNAAWIIYQRRYATDINAKIKPDIKLFLLAVSNGINSAIECIPKK